jgi:hypothetical protein
MKNTFVNILREPDSILFQFEDSTIRFEEPDSREEQNARIEYRITGDEGVVTLYPSERPVRRIKMRWRADLSPMTFGAICVAIITLIFGVLLLLVAYTPLLDIMPGYRTNAGRSREMLIRSIVRIDSLERKMNDMLTYNENRILVVSGKTPAIQSVKNDSLQRSKTIVAPSHEDSLLRQKMENDERYKLNKTQPNPSLQGILNAVSPMYGLISERFNAKNSLGVRINGDKGAQVSAIADGVVIISEWSPESGHTILVQHKNNFVSLYRNLSGVLVAKGTQQIGEIRRGEGCHRYRIRCRRDFLCLPSLVCFG